jgi:hypothetical protein
MPLAEGFEVQQEGLGHEEDKGPIIMQQRKGRREGFIRTVRELTLKRLYREGLAMTQKENSQVISTLDLG